jgi:hypothetical protein
MADPIVASWVVARVSPSQEFELERLRRYLGQREVSREQLVEHANHLARQVIVQSNMINGAARKIAELEIKLATIDPVQPPPMRLRDQIRRELLDRLARRLRRSAPAGAALQPPGGQGEAAAAPAARAAAAEPQTQQPAPPAA